LRVGDIQPHQPLALRPWVAPASAAAERPRLALATTCGQGHWPDLGDLVDAARDLGIDRLALGPACTPEQVEQVIARLGDDARLCSLHVACPHPVDDAGGLAALPSLADPDPLLGEVIVRWAEETIRLASYWGVPTVVLDLDEPTQVRPAPRDDVAHPASARGERLIAARSRLDDLALLCEEAGVRLALRTPRSRTALPQLSELVELLSAANPGQLGYWHDTGRAQLLEFDDGQPAIDWLTATAGWLAGYYLHDATVRDSQVTDAHQGRPEPIAYLVPGQGTVDFTAALSWATPETPLVVTLAGDVLAADLASSLDYLTQRLPSP
jgi:sugar phosphate isomerase/epimerase